MKLHIYIYIFLNDFPFLLDLTLTDYIILYKIAVFTIFLKLFVYKDFKRSKDTILNLQWYYVFSFFFLFLREKPLFIAW